MNIYSKVASAIDKLAGELEAKGFVGLAGDMDVVANAMDNSGMMTSLMAEIKRQLEQGYGLKGDDESDFNQAIFRGLGEMGKHISASQLLASFKHESQESEFLGRFDSRSAKAEDGEGFDGLILKCIEVVAGQMKSTGKGIQANIKDIVDMLCSAGTPYNEANVGDAGGPLDNNLGPRNAYTNQEQAVIALVRQNYNLQGKTPLDILEAAKNFSTQIGVENLLPAVKGLLETFKNKSLTENVWDESVAYLNSYLASKGIDTDPAHEAGSFGTAGAADFKQLMQSFVAAVLMTATPLSAAGVPAPEAAKQIVAEIKDGGSSTFSSSQKPMVEDAKVIEEWVSKEMAVKGPAIQAYQNSGTWGRAAMKYVVQEQLEMTLRKLANDKKAIIASHTEEQIANAITSSTNKHVKLILWVLEDIYKEGNGAKFAAHYLVTRAIK